MCGWTKSVHSWKSMTSTKFVDMYLSIAYSIILQRLGGNFVTHSDLFSQIVLPMIEKIASGFCSNQRQHLDLVT